MVTIGTNLQAVKRRIANAARECGREPGSIRLIAVSKTFSAQAIADAYTHGQAAFGENYVQEAVEKTAALSGLPLEWHFIGPIQSNKTGLIAEHFAWVHSIDRIKVARRLSDARPVACPALQVCLQINIGDEGSKSGVAPAAALELARAISGLPRLQLRGLMAIPPVSADPVEQRAYFAQLRRVKDGIVAAGIALDTLSMGMSADLEAAIAEGATLVRVGAAIFGPRERAMGDK